MNEWHSDYHPYQSKQFEIAGGAFQDIAIAGLAQDDVGDKFAEFLSMQAKRGVADARMAVKYPGQKAGGAQFAEDVLLQQRLVDARHRCGVEAAFGHSGGGELSAQDGVGNAFGGDGIHQAGGVADQQLATARERPVAWRERNEVAVAFDLLDARDAQFAQVVCELCLQVGAGAMRAENSHREMGSLGKHPGVAGVNGVEIESRHLAEAREIFVSKINLVFQRGGESGKIGPAGGLGGGAVNTVGGDDEFCA